MSSKASAVWKGGLKDGKVEYQSRRAGGAAEMVPVDAVADFIRERLAH